MARLLTLLFGAIAYLVFLASFNYAVLWLGDFLVPITIDHGRAASPVSAAVIDLLLLSGFALQHSTMARPAFKRWWTRIVSPAIERSTYVLAASLLLLAICLGWQPIPATVWVVQGYWALVLWALFWIGWLIVLTSTFMINHFDLFGLRQVWLHAQGRAASSPLFVERFLYRFVRHPIMMGFLIAFWSIPRMSVGHLLFAAVTSAYILIALQLEERDLVREHGAAYEAYRKRVPMLIPGIPREREAVLSEKRT